jgi:hypothetical protein
MQIYSTWQASKVLARLEAIRIGDSQIEFSRAVEGCKIDDGGYSVTAGAYRFELLSKVIQTLPEALSGRVYLLANRAGLRDWRLRTSATVQDGKIDEISTLFMVFGRYEMLGSGWRLASQIPSGYDMYLTNDDERRTHLGWFHITSLPASGEGFEIIATTRSSPKELQARSINRRCMLTSLGCDGLCELLPNAVPVLKERNRTWGGYTDVPAPHYAGH